MPSSDLSQQEFNDLLLKLITESTKVQAMFSHPSVGVRAIMSGSITIAPFGGLWVVERPGDSMGSTLTFDPSMAVVRKYGDERSIDDAELFGSFQQHFSSALSFAFADESSFIIFEIKE
jgi:hypothetical protein